jgi:hypothetical protein
MDALSEGKTTSSVMLMENPFDLRTFTSFIHSFIHSFTHTAPDGNGSLRPMRAGIRPHILSV